jgi:hypothetical protein
MLPLEAQQFATETPWGWFDPLDHIPTLYPGTYYSHAGVCDQCWSLRWTLKGSVYFSFDRNGKCQKVCVCHRAAIKLLSRHLDPSFLPLIRKWSSFDSVEHELKFSVIPQDHGKVSARAALLDGAVLCIQNDVDSTSFGSDYQSISNTVNFSWATGCLKQCDGNHGACSLFRRVKARLNDFDIPYRPNGSMSS